MADIRELLDIKLESPYFDEAYAKALADPELPYFLTEEYIHTLNDICHVLPKTYDKVLEVLPHVRAVPELVLLAKTLYYILDTREKYPEAFKAFTLPEAPKDSEHAVGYDTVTLFPILAHVKKSWDELFARGVGEDVAASSHAWMDSFFAEACEINGKLCFTKPYFAAYGVGIYVETLIIGRLRFEPRECAVRPVRIFENKKGEYVPLMDNTLIHKSGHVFGTYGCKDEGACYPADFAETADFYEGYTVDPISRLVVRERVRLSKEEWTPVFVSGGHALSVHIPGGGSITPELVADSYVRAKEIFTRCYPEYNFSCMLLNCWMLSPTLKEILAPTSNILSFASGYTVFPIQNDAKDAFLYVFKISGKEIPEIDLASLPEKNSLQRGVKQKSLEGKLIYQFGGYRPWN